jgi:hypothetical protein
MDYIWHTDLCKHKRELCIELRNNKNPALRKYFKVYCQILSKVIKETKRQEYDRHFKFE